MADNNMERHLPRVTENDLNNNNYINSQGLNFDGCDDYIDVGNADKILMYNNDNPHKNISLTLQDLSNVVMGDGHGHDLTNIGSTHQHNVGSLQGAMYDSTYDVESSNKREMENELKEMEILIASKNFPFEVDMIQSGMMCRPDKMEEVCRQIHTMKWIVTTGLCKNEYENDLRVKYDLPPEGALMYKWEKGKGW